MRLYEDQLNRDCRGSIITGFDRLGGGDVMATITGTFQADFLNGTSSPDTIRGGFGHDTIFGNEGADLLFGEAGNDFIDGGTGGDRLNGGSGDDRLQVGVNTTYVGDEVIGGGGIDTLIVNFSGRSSAITFAPLDPLSTYGVAGFTVTGVERYEVRGTAFSDTLNGWLHDDEITGGDGADIINGKAGGDFLQGEGGGDTIHGGSGSDFIIGDTFGQAFADKLFGDDGADTLSGGGGNDELDGGLGGDSLFGEDGNDKLVGGGGDDLLEGNDGADNLSGGEGHDVIVSGTGLADLGLEKDVINAGGGDDEVLAGVGDFASGGAGTDTIDLDFRASAVAVSYILTAAVTTLANGTKIDGFERLDFSGGSGADNVTGGALQDTLEGGGGNDTLSGSGGEDILDGRDGADILNGGGGDDVLRDSGTGNDTLNGGTDDDLLEGRDGADTLNGNDGDDFFFLHEDGALGDMVNGGTGSDFVDYSQSFSLNDLPVFINLANQTLNDGAAKNDRFTSVENVFGSNGGDVIVGNDLANFLGGQFGDDLLQGGGGGDFLDGGANSDTLTGGAGADRFLLEAGGNEFDSLWPADIITDFVRGTDKLQINTSLFGENVTFSAGPGVQSGGAAPHLHFDTSKSRLWYDADGSGLDQTPVLIVTLQGVTNLALADFIVVSDMAAAISTSAEAVYARPGRGAGTGAMFAESEGAWPDVAVDRLLEHAAIHYADAMMVSIA